MSFNGSEPLYYPADKINEGNRLESLYFNQQEKIESLNPANPDNSRIIVELHVITKKMKALQFVDGKDIRLTKKEKIAEIKERSFFPLLHN